MRPGDAHPNPLHAFCLDSLDVHRADGRVKCALSLRAGSRSIAGSATETDTPAGRARAAARATLTAVESLDADLRLGLHGARIIDVFGHESMVVLVEGAVGRSHTHLTGSALVERSVEEAAVMATLMALRSWEA